MLAKGGYGLVKKEPEGSVAKTYSIPLNHLCGFTECKNHGRNS